MGEQVAAGLKFKGQARPLNGGVAQLGEHLPCKQGVKGSNPSISIGQTGCPKNRPKVLLYLENRILIKILKYQRLQNEI